MAPTPKGSDTDDVIDLFPQHAPDGSVVWSIPDTGPANVPIEIDDAGVMSRAGTPLSTLPADRMAADAREWNDWNRIISTITDAEAGRRPAEEIIVEPGGELSLVRRGQADTALSKLPEDRMAAFDHDEVRRLDPANREGWEFIADRVIPGFSFAMTPIGKQFRFFCFRSASYGGNWLLSVLHPNLDDLPGHEAHIMHVRLGSGRSIPVVCRSERRLDHPTLGEVRGTAAKFALYHSLRKHGHVPFSA